MAIASIGTGGTGTSSTSGTSFTLSTATNTINAANNRFAVLTVVSDNTGTTDVESNEITSVTGGNGTWTKIGEYRNGNGAAAAGVTTALYLFVPSGANATGTTFTINLSAARVEKVASLWVFSKGAGLDVAVDSAAALQFSGADGGQDFGTAAFSGLPSRERLYFRGCGKEANSLTALTPSANFTVITPQRSRNNAAAQLVRGEFRINTSTGETSSPTMAVTGDTSCVFAALVEVAATQTLTPALFTNDQTFFGPTVTRGAVTLTPALFTNDQTFFGPTVSGSGGAAEFVAASQNGLTGTSITVTTPAGAIGGDLIVAYVQSNATIAIDLPAGWTKQDGGGSGSSQQVFTTTHDGVAADYTFTAPSSVAMVVILLAYRNVTFGATSAFSSSVVNPTPPNITVPTSASLNVTLVGSGTTGLTYSMPAGWTSRASRTTQRSMAVFERDTTVSDGVLAGVTVTLASGTGNSRAIQFSLTPNTPPPPEDFIGSLAATEGSGDFARFADAINSFYSTLHSSGVHVDDGSRNFDWGDQAWQVDGDTIGSPAFTKDYMLRWSGKKRRVRFEMRGDNGDTRTELDDKDLIPVSTSVWGALTVLAESWSDPTAMAASPGYLIMQHHYGAVGGSPAFALRRAANGDFIITTRNSTDNGGSNNTRYTGTLSFEQPHDIVWRTVTNETSGEAQVWIDGVEVLNLTGIPLGQTDSPNYFKFGMYGAGGIGGRAATQFANVVPTSTTSLSSRISSPPAWPQDALEAATAPVVLARQPSASNTNSTSFTPTLATHATGDYLMVVVTVDGSGTAPSTATSGWTRLLNTNQGTDLQQAIFYYGSGGVLTAAPSGSVSAPVISQDSEMSSAMAFTLQAGSAPTIEAAASSGGSNSNTDPPPLTLAGGERAALWIATAGVDGIINVPTAGPPGYVNLNSAVGGATGGTITTTAEWRGKVAKEDPGIFIRASEQFVHHTIALSVAEVGGAQGLTPVLFTNTQTFYAPTVTQAGGPQTIAPSLFTNTQTFFASAVTSVRTLTPALYTNPQTFYAPVVTATRTLTPALFTNTQTFFGPAVAATQNLAHTLFTNSHTFFGPTVSLVTGTQTLTPTLFANTQTLFGATIEIFLAAPRGDRKAMPLPRGDRKAMPLPQGARQPMQISSTPRDPFPEYTG